MSTLAVLGRRACSALAIVSAGLHLLMALSGSGFGMTVFAVVMAGACIVCARHLWRGAELTVWCGIALMNLAMIATHLSFGACHDAGPVEVAGTAGAMSSTMVLGTGVAVAEVVIAVTVIFLRTRRISIVPQVVPVG